MNMASQDVNILAEMGFPRSKALLAHADESLPTDPSVSSEAVNSALSQSTVEQDKQEGGSDEVTKDETEEPKEATANTVAKSLKCNECSRLFISPLEIEFHAAKTGHNSFFESDEEKRPLTEEEKKEQVKRLEEKMRQKRQEREEAEKREALEKEKLRIRHGKEMVAAKKKLGEDEMKKLVEQHKWEKMEEKMARQRVKEQIEQDKIARRAKFGIAAPTGGTQQMPVTAVELTPQQASLVQQPTKDYSQTRLQIRLTNGQALTQTFGSKEQLSAVRLYVEMNRTDGSGPFCLMTNFPKKVFSDDDYEKPLDLLGLVPSAVVIVSRTQ
ncbi:UBX domain-containing protein 1 isoform X2 [Zootermopsis nevadensis]|uniref:UBX domain-containing protein 1 isoform X2 n=1 Tax=Zootermopsis nevadensis TaxID=136037 RepID=UPI000B8E71A9|nr:UBX domain-containing protein 1 isoform X2 [Zootermopsis nevadensis]